MARKYVHHNKKEEPKSLSISLGSVNDSFDYLKQLCNDKSVELLKTIEVNDDAKIVIRTMAGEVGVGSVKVSSDKKKIILTTHW